MEFLGVGLGEAGLILVITLIVVGPKRFPQIAREGGKWYRTARQYADEVMKDVRGAMDDLEREVTEQGEELRGIREVGRDLNRIGTDARDAASSDSPPSSASPEGGAGGRTEANR